MVRSSLRGGVAEVDDVIIVERGGLSDSRAQPRGFEPLGARA